MSPVKVIKRTGSKPYKIVEKSSGKVVGSSTSKTKADSSARARNAAHFSDWKSTGKKRRS